MRKLHLNLLATACLALAAAAGFAPSAQAQNCSGQANGNCGAGPYTFGKRDIFGGGSSLVAPYWRQTMDCYSASGDSAALITKATPPTIVDESFFNYAGTPPANCPLGINTHGATEWYISTGSGTGIKGVYTNDPTQYGFVNSGQTQYFPFAMYGLSDAGLGSSDVSVYNSGGTEQGITFAASGNQACGTKNGSIYPNPLQCFGPLVQFPFSIDPVAMFYGGSATGEQTNGDPVGAYEKWDDKNGNETIYTLNVQNQRSDGSGGLRLSPTSYCGIWNGQITNWNDSRLTTDNAGVTLADPSDPAYNNGFSVQLIPVGRADSSGTTSIITRHLANVCASFSYNLYQTGATTLQAAGSNMSTIIGTTYNTSNPNYPGVDQPGKITLASNSSGVAQYVAFTASPAGFGTSGCADAVPAGAQDCIQQARVGYVGPDYVLPYVNSTNTNSYGLQSATLQNSSGNWEAPSPKTANAAFASIQPPQSTKTGKYCSSCLNWGMRNDPTAWVESPAPTQPLADPTASGAYPLVGTTNFLGYTCYANTGNQKLGESTLVSALHFVDDNAINFDTGVGILAKAGLSPLPKQWITAIQETFVANTSGLGLNIRLAGSAGSCSTVTYGG